eukprot:m.131361 g.131361  ORF g.131361 m.131361 type:complete len:223 (+) comp16815_c0_seq3:874-1542(+)
MAKPPPSADVSTHTCYDDECTHRWVPALSDTELEFDDENRVARRVGNTGCYPAVTSSWIPESSGESVFVMEVSRFPDNGINKLTFGVAVRMERGVRECIGHRLNSVGVQYNPRGSNLFRNMVRVHELSCIKGGARLAVLIDADSGRVRFFQNGRVVVEPRKRACESSGDSSSEVDNDDDGNDGNDGGGDDSDGEVGWHSLPGPIDECRVWATLNDDAEVKIA